MNTMKWLIRREFWEHRGVFLRLPIIIGLALLLFVLLATMYGTMPGHVQVNGQALPMEHMGQVAAAFATYYMAVSTPIFLALSVVLFFYCLSAMHDERRDRSILFWKSLPVSDSATVLAKLATALGVAPLIAIGAAIVASVLVLLLVCIGMAVGGMSIFGPLLAQPALYLAPLQLLALLPVYALWALPTVGWLLLVSSWARSRVFLWAVGLPVLCTVTVKMIALLFDLGWNVDWFAQHIVARVLSGLVPGVWLPIEQIDTQLFLDADTHMLKLGVLVQQSWLSLTHMNVWLGAAAGAAMIAAAIRLRRSCDEV
ncbi:MAG: hypothetical protein V4582_24145 [Pseudomonadota bacterium]